MIPHMARLCTICSHPQRSAIDKKIAADAPIRTIAKEFGLPKSTLQRHKNECAGLKNPPVEERREPTRGTIALALMPSREELASRYQTLGERIDELIAKAEKTGSLAIAVQGLNSLRQNWDSLSKLAGHVGQGAQVNVGVQVNISAADIAAELAKHLAGTDARVIEEVVLDGDG